MLGGEGANFVAITWDCPFSVWKPTHVTLRNLHHHYRLQCMPPKSLYHQAILLKSLNTQHGSFVNLSFLRSMSHTRLDVHAPCNLTSFASTYPPPPMVLVTLVHAEPCVSQQWAALGCPWRGHNPSSRPLIDVVLAGNWYQARSVPGLIACASLLMFIRYPVPRKQWTSQWIEYDLQLEPRSMSECNRTFGNSGYDSSWRPWKAVSNPGRKPSLRPQPWHLLEKAGGSWGGLMLSLRTEWSDPTLCRPEAILASYRTETDKLICGDIHAWRYF